jgi:hypothetical protein
MIKFYLKCRRVIETFYGRKVREEVIKFDHSFISMGIVVISS